MAQWDAIKGRLIERIDAEYHVFEGPTFKHDRFMGWLERVGIPWPLLDSGRLDLSDETFREMARAHPKVAPLHQLRHSLAQLRLNDLAVGADGRNRAMLSAFRSKTGRNQPSNTRFIFGPSAWLRGLIQPPNRIRPCLHRLETTGVRHRRGLERRKLMMEAYRSGDPYLAFAKQAGAVPADATKSSHKAQRDLFKACVLAVQYGMGEDSLGQRIGKPPIVARQL